MKRELGPGVIVVAIAVAVLVAGFLFLRGFNSAPATPSAAEQAEIENYRGSSAAKSDPGVAGVVSEEITGQTQTAPAEDEASVRRSRSGGG